jgi:glycine/D-amino acid oxidase-like deaminating enzyme
MTTADVVIIGGGCMGASVAYHLAQRGVTNVILLEREPTLGAGSTGRNAGGVRHQFSHEANVRLSIESISLFERFEDELGAPIDFHQDGYLFLLSTQDHVDAFRAAVAMQRRLGIDVQWLEPREAAALAPGLRVDGISAATFCARDGICDPNGVTMGFAQAAQRAGVEIRRSTAVTALHVDDGCITAVETENDRISTRTVVNAAGPWARAIGAMAGVELPIDPLRRHIFIAEPPREGGWASGGVGGSPAAPANRIMVIDFDSTFYFHREGANVLFGMGDPSEQIGFDLTVDWTVLEKIAPVAAARLPALADAAIAHAWAGLYEMTPDAMPILGPAGASGMYVIAGFSGHGFQHSPAAGRLLADVITGRDPAFDLQPFASERFHHTHVSRESNVV